MTENTETGHVSRMLIDQGWDFASPPVAWRLAAELINVGAG
ncbi:MAG: hypothetical protein U5S82_13750 [Gammaproteobacteria bacterium]|nr:hypothetical protein [Gammaproteobacteria bacterium]